MGRIEAGHYQRRLEPPRLDSTLAARTRQELCNRRIYVTSFALHMQICQQSCAGGWQQTGPGGAASLSRANQWVLPQNQIKSKAASTNRMKAIHRSARKYNLPADI